MIFFFLLPAISGVLGNLILPKLLKVRDLAFPKVNVIGWYCLFLGGLLMFLVVLSGGFDTGWTFRISGPTSDVNNRLVLASVSVMLSALSMILLAVNQVTSIVRMRQPSVGWRKLSIFSWSLMLSGLIALLAVPILILTLLVLMLQNWLGWGLFNEDPMIQRKLFWFFGRPALYMMILPAIGIVSEIIASLRSEGLVGKRLVIGSMIAISVLGLFGAGSHLMTGAQPVGLTLFSTFLNLLTILPFSLLILSWIRTMATAMRDLNAALMYTIGCLLLMVIGGLSGIILATSGANAHLHNTHFVLAHFHYLLAGCVVMAYLGGLHFWWEEITGTNFLRSNGLLSAVLLFTGINFTFFPMFILGFLGMLRRHPTYPEEFETLAQKARELGFIGAASGPYVRSSYNAGEVLEGIREGQLR